MTLKHLSNCRISADHHTTSALLLLQPQEEVHEAAEAKL
jgi:hypothetical protein